jgi:hypothetical protein
MKDIACYILFAILYNSITTYLNVDISNSNYWIYMWPYTFFASIIIILVKLIDGKTS